MNYDQILNQQIQTIQIHQIQKILVEMTMVQIHQIKVETTWLTLETLVL